MTVKHNFAETDKPNVMRCLSCGKEFECMNPLGVAVEIPSACPHCGAETFIVHNSKVVNGCYFRWGDRRHQSIVIEHGAETTKLERAKCKIIDNADGELVYIHDNTTGRNYGAADDCKAIKGVAQ